MDEKNKTAGLTAGKKRQDGGRDAVRFSLIAVVVRIGPSASPSKHSILLNCHFDTLPDTPGATDDAVSCAIMVDILEVLAHTKVPLEHDIIFLFNGAEENFLQASHGFITQHKWRHFIRAFINLEGTGAVPYPHSTVIAQEVFQSNVIPSDTDFRVFRDHGRISGLDIAYIRNGWVYHTEFDKPEFIDEGAIQRSGENILALAKALIKSPYLKQPANFDEGNKWVFYDIMGLYTVFYEVGHGAIVNICASLLVWALIAFRLHSEVYTVNDLLSAFSHHGIAFVGFFRVSLLAGCALVGYVYLFNLTMFWYACPELVFPFYIVPMIIVGFWTHAFVAEKQYKGINAEMFHYDSVLAIWSIVLMGMTAKGLASAFFILIHVIFPLLRDPLIFLLGKIGAIKVVSPRVVLYTQCFCLIPVRNFDYSKNYANVTNFFFLVLAFVSYGVMLFFDFFVPVMGRLGNLVNPEFVMMPISLLTAFTFLLFTKTTLFLKASLALSLLGIVLISTTRIGEPYRYSETSPRLRRIIALHSKRTIYDFGGKLNSTDTGLFVQSLDYRGIDDLPAHTFLQDCSHTHDEYCRLPYYTAIHELFPPDQSRWVPLPATLSMPKPVSVRIIDRQQPAGNQLNITLLVRGGADKISYHVTPLNGYTLKKWSFTPIDFVQKSTYFVFLGYGFEAPTERTLWILLENHNPSPPDPETTPSLEFAVATHYAHGPDQNTETLLQLRALIKSRRETPHAAVGYWKWAITAIAGRSEIVVHQF
uniref:FXNA-like protease n=1 Tax=Ditylenchus dipsaci TaxID=166011 RepID=A0A915ETZ4_9BILA